METEGLRWFQLVADGLTVTEVAQTYAVGQPQVSRALARLESEVGTPLLRRSGRVLRLTHAGTAFKKHVDALVNALDDGLAAVDSVVDPERGIVTLAYPLSLGVWFVPWLLRDFARAHPRVRVVLERTVVGPGGAASAVLTSRKADLEITTHTVTEPGVQWRRVAIEPLLAGLPLDHRLAGEQRIGLADLASEPWVMRRGPSGMRSQVLELCAAAGFTPRIEHDVDDLPTVRGLVSAGLGVGVLPAMGMDAPTTLGGARLLPLSDRGAHREIGVAWLAERGRLPAAELLRRFVLERARPAGEPPLPAGGASR